MIRRNTGILTSLLLLFLLHLTVCPAFHKCQELVETEFLHPIPVFENHHHEDLMANRESKVQHVSLFDALIFAIPPLTINLYLQVSYHSIPSLIFDQKTTNLRC
jgi:hypothetical protein